MAEAEDPKNGWKDELSPELQERAAKYAQEELSHREIFIEDLQSSLKASEVPTDECRLLRFLRACEFRIQQTTNTIKSFYKYKANNPELFKPLALQEAADIVNRGLMGVLPGRDVQGGKVLYIKIGLWEPDQTPMMHLFRMAISLQLNLIKDPETQIGGLRTLSDMEGLTWIHAKSFSIPEMRKMAKFYEEAFPARFDGFHNINQSPFIERAYTLLKPFTSVRLKGRTRFHGNAHDDVHEFIAVSNLPVRYGGDVSDQEIQDYTMSLLNDYEGDDFGGTGSKISKIEDKVASDTVVSASASGTYRKIEPS